MKCVFDYKALAAFPARPRIISIGNFDGVHLGHQAVLAKARQDADQMDLALAVLTFEPHPTELLSPEASRLRLATPERKVALLGQSGADLVLIQRFDSDFAHLSAQCFAADVLAKALCAKHVIVGENFRFGHGREGNVTLLRQYGQELGFEVSGEHLIRFAEADVSSSRIRKHLLDGDVTAAKQLLGRYHEMPGKVIADRGHGTAIGIPTINLANIQVVIPGPGIYAAYCDIGDKTEKAAVYIGNRPTLGFGYSVEAHLLGVSENLYDRDVVLRFVARVRGDETFDSEAQLIAQIKKDIAHVQTLMQ
ncbi:MAG: riboflavin biosynthesis protein RibF [Myxococcota bacterium]|nr:riboflavin biosynthesis protein RibF [Myxococcota bacterium]